MLRRLPNSVWARILDYLDIGDINLSVLFLLEEDVYDAWLYKHIE